MRFTGRDRRLRRALPAPAALAARLQDTPRSRGDLEGCRRPVNPRGLTVAPTGSTPDPKTDAAYAKLISKNGQRSLTAEEQRREPLNLEKASAQLTARLVQIEAAVETGQRADMLVTSPKSGARVAIEMQCSPLTAAEWRSRQDTYGRLGGVVLAAAAVWLTAELINIAWPREVGLPWWQEWAFLLGMTAFGLTGLAYFLARRPDRRFTAAGKAMEPVHTTPWFHATNIPNAPASNLVQMSIGGWYGSRPGMKVAHERQSTVITISDVEELGIEKAVEVAPEYAWKDAERCSSPSTSTRSTPASCPEPDRPSPAACCRARRSRPCA